LRAETSVAPTALENMLCLVPSPSGAGLRSFAPPALSCTPQIAACKPQVAHCEARATTRVHKSTAIKSQPRRSSDKARALEARHNVAQPGRAGTGGNPNSQHRRCGTLRPRTTVLTQTLKPRVVGMRTSGLKLRPPKHHNRSNNFQNRTRPAPVGTGSQTVTFRLPAVGGTAVPLMPLDPEVMKPPICCKSVCSVEKACWALWRFPACRDCANSLKSCAIELVCCVEEESCGLSTR
jgi:hypothetical protein